MRLSLTLSLYIVRQFLFGVLMVLAVFGMLIFMLDMLELVKRASNKDIPFLVLVEMGLLKFPQVGQKVLPFAILIGTVLSYSKLTRTQELAVMRSAGVSVWQFLLPALLAASILGGLVIILINPVSCAMISQYERMENKYFRGRSSFMDVSADGIWLRQQNISKDNKVIGETILNAQHTAGMLDKLELQDVTMFVFALGKTGKPDHFIRRIDAKSASLLDNFWQLKSVIVTDSDSSAVKHDEYFLETTLTVKDIHNSFAPPDTISFWALPSFIRKLQESGFSALQHRLYWHTILLSPLFFTAMVTIGALFSLRPARQGRTGLLITASILTGFLIYFLTNLVSSFGLSGSMPVLVAAWAPVIACMLTGVGLLLHVEDG